VLAVTLVGDEKRRLGERRISAMGRFLLPSLKAEWNCVGGSDATLRLSLRAGFLEKREKWRTPSCFARCQKNNALYFAVKVAHPPEPFLC
jgi:hypothetical protein